ncbi:spondin domain-containing protein [Ancylomarina sp. YFZ004]
MKNLIYASIASMFLFTACLDDDDDRMEIPVEKGTFTVKIENIQTGKAYFNSGTTDGIGPGGSYTFSFNAGKGAKLSLATMLAQTNDLFYGFGDEGLSLYTAGGDAVVGDVSSELMLWDAGTEVNQMPGTGSDQAPRQTASNTGATENGTVKLIADVNDGYIYPALSEVIKAELAHDGGTEFTVTITNVSDMYAFQSPLAPGVWVVHNSGMPIFTENEASANGLEGLAEDGMNSDLSTYLDDMSGYVSPFAPGVFAISNQGYPLFEDGMLDMAAGLEALAEDGSPGTLDASLDGKAYVLSHGVFSIPNGMSAGAPIFPGEYYEFSFEAQEGDYLNLATMLVQSNDLFVAFDDMGLALFNNGIAKTGDVTSMLMVWDAGTEVNEYPGAGNNQAPRQAAANTGTSESKTVMVVDDEFVLPSVEQLVRVTISFN